MRIGIDALSVLNLSGTGYYTQELLLALASCDPDNEYFVFVPEDCLLTVPRTRDARQNQEAKTFGRRLRRAMNKRPKFQSILVSRRSRMGRILWQQVYLPREARRLNLDLLHSPTGIAPLRLRCPSAITLHDMAFDRFPDLFPSFQRFYLKRFLPASAKRASAILTDSEFSASEIRNRIKISKDRIRPVLLGVSTLFEPVEDADRLQTVSQTYRLPERFILALGTVEPRKNLLTLLDAFERVTERDKGFRLVLAGRKGWLEEPVFERIEALRLAGRILWTDFISREDLPALYSLSTLCVYLSLYEGFGLPVLEAMACGTPVVASDIPVFREWAAGAAELVPPENQEAVADALSKVATEEEIRQRMRESGLAIAREFTWERTAQATLEAYREVVSRKNGDSSANMVDWR